MHYWLVMPAAGAGRRLGAPTPKQYLPLAGRTLIEWALAPFTADPRCRGIVVALAADDPYWPALTPGWPAGRVSTTPGGAERSDSVLAGLAALPAQPDDWVLVHDAARPCVTPAERDALLAGVAEHPVGGLLAVPLADTLKRADADGRVAATVPRARLWRALTPQMFRHGPLREALRSASSRGDRPTDESQAMELAGLAPLLVEGSPQNLKVTTVEDLALAEAVLRTREGAR